MGNLFSQKCDLCGNVQTEEDHSKISGTTIVMNGVSRFACAGCRDILHAAFSVGVGGLRDPMTKLAEVVKERDQLRRLVAQGAVQREEGTVALAGVELDHMAAQRWNKMAPEERRGLGLGPVPIAGSLGGGAVPHRLGQADGKKPQEKKPEEPKKGILGNLGFKKKPKK